MHSKALFALFSFSITTLGVAAPPPPYGGYSSSSLALSSSFYHSSSFYPSSSFLPSSSIAVPSTGTAVPIVSTVTTTVTTGRPRRETTITVGTTSIQNVTETTVITTRGPRPTATVTVTSTSTVTSVNTTTSTTTATTTATATATPGPVVVLNAYEERLCGAAEVTSSGSLPNFREVQLAYDPSTNASQCVAIQGRSFSWDTVSFTDLPGNCSVDFYHASGCSGSDGQRGYSLATGQSTCHNVNDVRSVRVTCSA